MELPAFLEQALQTQYGAAQTARITEGFLVERAVTLRSNPLKASHSEVCAALDEAGIAYSPVPWYDHGLIIQTAREPQIAALPLYEAGGVYLQSLSSMLPPLVLAPAAGESILDMAAAPGGKTTQMAAMTMGKAGITACEKNKIRAERLQYNLRRQGAGSVYVLQQDARQLDELFRFDKILLDAPCSGSGTLSVKHSNGKFSQELVTRSVKTQTALLQKALKLLKPGGTLVYSTCSILECENEAVVKSVLSKQVALQPVDPADFAGLPLLPTTLPGTLCVCPDALYEGFFVAKLTKLA